MIINISDREFRRILDNPKFNLPIRWSGDDFRLTVDGLFNQYINNFSIIISNRIFCMSF